MTISPGTGAGIGVALGLLVLLLAGPGAYYYRKRRRQQSEKAGEYGSRDAEIFQAGDDHYSSGGKPQLDDTAVSPETAWRISRSTVDDGPTVVQEIAAADTGSAPVTARGIGLTHPTILRAGPKGPRAQELDVSYDDRRPELSTEAASPPPTELRTDKSPPVEGISEKGIEAVADPPVESRREFAKSDESMQLPALPGPLLPPKQPSSSAQP